MTYNVFSGTLNPAHFTSCTFEVVIIGGGMTQAPTARSQLFMGAAAQCRVTTAAAEPLHIRHCSSSSCTTVSIMSAAQDRAAKLTPAFTDLRRMDLEHRRQKLVCIHLLVLLLGLPVNKNCTSY